MTTVEEEKKEEEKPDDNDGKVYYEDWEDRLDDTVYPDE